MSRVQFKLHVADPSVALSGNVLARVKVEPPPGPGMPQSRLVLAVPNLTVNPVIWPTVALERGRYAYVFDIVAGLAPFAIAVEVEGIEVAREDIAPSTLHTAKHLSILFHV